VHVGNIGDELTDMMVECFQGFKTDQLHRVTEKRDLGTPETVIIHMGTNDLRITRNRYFLLGEVYVLMAKAKRKF
jgi:hypothetical protein